MSFPGLCQTHKKQLLSFIYYIETNEIIPTPLHTKNSSKFIINLYIKVETLNFKKTNIIF